MFFFLYESNKEAGDKRKNMPDSALCSLVAVIVSLAVVIGRDSNGCNDNAVLQKRLNGCCRY